MGVVISLRASPVTCFAVRLMPTFASFAIAAGVPLFELSRYMGTSVGQIEKTYGHLLPDSFERARTALDSFLEFDSEREADQGLWSPFVTRA